MTKIVGYFIIFFMKLSTKGRYAVTAMLDLVIHMDDGPVSLSDIAERQHVSLSYLEQLFAKLRRRGLVASTRGPGGGYSLNDKPENVAVVDIILAVDENIDNTNCSGAANCQHDEQCLTHDLWEDLSNQIKEFLAGISLAELASRGSIKRIAARQDGVEQDIFPVTEMPDVMSKRVGVSK